MPWAVLELPPVTVLDVIVTVPVLALVRPKARVELPPVNVLEVIVTVPVLAF